ncbi:MAG: D-arabinose 5-phosphate isomerase [Flavobacteriales bacterium]|jgi:arabinose-5-phosphate isomerase|nr:D-arabinose 5-phosphate isomerase [Flavobacteriales bacterium]
MKHGIDIIKVAKELINDQLLELRKLSDNLEQDFVDVIEALSNCQGRLIIIGLGKSGIIGRKISATLNSTGTFSSFIHASDALHGDAGNINFNDIVMFISNSGNTDELKQLVPLVKKMNIPIITMTGNMRSFLALESDFILNVNVSKEACPNNLAPTTSTTMQLVMGDAIAVSLLKIKNFSKEDFAKYHPAGSLGKKLNMEVSDLCDFSNPPKVFLGDSLDKIIFEISSKRLGATAVLDSNTIVGIITDGDLRRMLEKEIEIKTISASFLMTKNPKTIQKKTLLYEAFSLMKKHNITQLLVKDGEQYVGIIHLHDILKCNIF